MKGTNKRSLVLWYTLLAGVIALYCIWFNLKEPEINYDYRVPPSPSERYVDKYWLWDSGQKKWILKNLSGLESYPSSDRANVIIKHELDEDALQEYLEEHIDGYIEETYWGEEYNLNDIDHE